MEDSGAWSSWFQQTMQTIVTDWSKYKFQTDPTGAQVGAGYVEGQPVQYVPVQAGPGGIPASYWLVGGVLLFAGLLVLKD